MGGGPLRIEIGGPVMLDVLAPLPRGGPLPLTIGLAGGGIDENLAGGFPAPGPIPASRLC
jgi:hypothetical protein